MTTEDRILEMSVAAKNLHSDMTDLLIDLEQETPFGEEPDSAEVKRFNLLDGAEQNLMNAMRLIELAHLDRRPSTR